MEGKNGRIVVSIIFSAIATLMLAVVPGCNGLSSTTLNQGLDAQPRLNDDYSYPGRASEDVLVPERFGLEISELGDDTVAVAGSTDLIQPGTVLVSEQGQGFMRKVIGLDSALSTETTSVYKTRDAGLLDVLQEAEFHHFEPMNYEDLKDPDYLAEGVTIEPLSAKETAEFYASRGVSGMQVPDGARVPSAKVGLPVKVSFPGLTMQTADKTSSVLVNGSFAFELGIEIDAKVGWDFIIPYLDRFKFGPYASAEAYVSIEAARELILEKSKKLYSKTFKPIKLIVGGVPLLFYPEYTLSLDLTGAIQARIDMAYEFTADFETGVQYNRGDGWSTYFDVSTTDEFSPPEFKVAGTLEIALKNELALKLYGAVGPKVDLTTPSVKGYATMRFYNLPENISPDIPVSDPFHPKNVELKVDLNLNLNAEVKVELFGATLKDWKLPGTLSLLGGGVVLYEDTEFYVFEYDDAKISGSVVDELGNPLPKVPVTITGPVTDGKKLPRNIVTDSEGKWAASIPAAPGGTFTALYGDARPVLNLADGGWKPNYGNEIVHHNIPSQTFVANYDAGSLIQLQPAAGEPNVLSGQVLDEADQPVPGLSVTVAVEYYVDREKRETAEYSAMVITDTDGNWEVSRVPFNEYFHDDLRVIPELIGWHYSPINPSVNMRLGSYHLKQTMKPNTVYGLIQDEDQIGLPDVEVNISGTGAAGHFEFQTFSDQDGAWGIEEVPSCLPGEAAHVVTVQKEGIRLFPDTREFRFYDRDFNAGFFTSELTYSAIGTVVDYLGAPMPDVRIELAGAWGGETMSDANGDWNLQYALRRNSNYRIEPVFDQYWFDPPYEAFYLETGDVPGLSFVAYPQINANSVFPVGATLGTGSQTDPYRLAVNSTYEIQVLDVTDADIATFCDLSVSNGLYMLNGSELTTFEFGPPAQVKVEREGDPNSPVTFWVAVWE